MRREDVGPLLQRAADRLPEPDLADAAWAEGLATRRRRRRSILIGLLVMVVVALVAAIGAGVSSGNKADFVPPTTPPSDLGSIAPAGQIAGIDYWMAPPPGSERFLDRLETPLGDRLQLPDKAKTLSDHPIDRIAAVVLTKHGAGYTPVLLGSDSSWSLADVELVPIASGTPLSPGTVSPDGRMAAFPQPGELVTVNASTAEVTHYDVPTEDLRSVSWLGDAQRVLVSGPGVAYRVLVGEGGFGEGALVKISGAGDPEAVTAPFRLDTGAVMRYLASGQWSADSGLTLPVRRWVGQTFSSESAAARLFIAGVLPEVPTKVAPAQVVAAISTLRTQTNRLLVLGESDTARPSTEVTPFDRAGAREPGCCSVLGWYDQNTPLLQVRGWVLAWDLTSGRVRRVTELAVDGLAVGPGVRP